MSDVDNKIREAVLKQQNAQEREEKLRQEYPQVFQEIDAINKLRQEVEDDKTLIKDMLIAEDDFDTHQVEGVNVSVSRLAKLVVADETQVDPQFKTVETVVDVKEATKAFRGSGIIPQGFKDQSSYRFNFKVVKNVRNII